MKLTLRKKILPQVIASTLASGMVYAEADAGQGYTEMAVISVTANKIEEDIKDVPQSITVIDETLIEEKGMKSVVDVVKSTPNVNITTYGSPTRIQTSIRGLNTSIFTNNNPLVMYIDGLPYSDSYGFDLLLVNVERIEVLRGPQATLYGKDAVGGVINVVTKEPTNEWTGSVGTEFGRYNSREFNFNTSGAVKEDELYIGLNGQFRADDGWQTNSYPGTEKDASKFEDRRWSAFVLYEPTDEFSAKFTYSNDYTDAYGNNGHGISGATLSDFKRKDAENIIAELDTREELKVDSQALQLAYDFGHFTLASVTTHRSQEMNAIYDFDVGNNPMFGTASQFDNQDRDAWTQELTVKSNNSEGLRYVAGIYLDKSERKRGPYGWDFPGFGLQNAVSESDEKTAALFGQVIYPMSDQLDLTLGGRYQRIKKDIHLDFLVNDALFHTVEGEKSWSQFLPKAALNYRFNDNWSGYVSYSEGYMPGGFNFFATSGSLDDNSFEPQISTNYEIGVKGQTGKMTLGAALFYMDIEDIHVFRSEGPLFFTDNAKKAHSVGIEVEASYQVNDQLELSAAVGLIEAEYDDYNAGSGVTYDGEKIEQTPDFNVNLAAAYYHPNGFYGRADLKVTGETGFFDSGAQAFPKQDTYTTLDARIGYVTGDWELYAYGKNLTDEEYITGYRANTMISIASFNDPRTIGAGVKYNF